MLAKTSTEAGDYCLKELFYFFFFSKLAVFVMHSSNPSVPRQPECVVGTIKSLEARGSRHSSLSGAAC